MHTEGTDVRNRRVQQGEATRRHLIDTAVELFGARGYAGTSLAEIAAVAEVTKGAVYHHFEGKESLFLAAYEQVRREIADRVGAHFFRADGYFAVPDPWAALVQWCEALLDANLDARVRRICLIDAPAVLDWETLREIDGRHGGILLRAVIRSSMHKGILRRQALGPVARLITAALFEASVEIAHADDRDAARTELFGVFISLLSGLRAPGGS